MIWRRSDIDLLEILVCDKWIRNGRDRRHMGDRANTRSNTMQNRNAMQQIGEPMMCCQICSSWQRGKAFTIEQAALSLLNRLLPCAREHDTHELMWNFRFHEKLMDIDHWKEHDTSVRFGILTDTYAWASENRARIWRSRSLMEVIVLIDEHVQLIELEQKESSHVDIGLQFAR